jgi:hypothetical protein
MTQVIPVVPASPFEKRTREMKKQSIDLERFIRTDKRLMMKGTPY